MGLSKIIAYLVKSIKIIDSKLLQNKKELEAINKNMVSNESFKKELNKYKLKEHDIYLINVLNDMLKDNKEFPYYLIEHKHFSMDRNISKINLMGLGLEFCNLECITFEDCYLKNLNISDSFLMSCKFINCDLSHCWFSDSKFNSCKFVNCNLTGTRFDDCNLKYCDFSECNLKEARFDDSNLKYATIKDSIILRTVFKGVDIEKDGWFDYELIRRDRENNPLENLS